MTQGGWNDAAGAVLVAVFAAPQGDGVDRVAVAMNRSAADAEIRLPDAARRHGVAGAHRHRIVRRRPSVQSRSPTGCGFDARSSLILAEARTAKGGPGSGAPSAETIDTLASAAGIAAEWWDVGGKRTIVSPETKIALLAALGLDVGSEAAARDSLDAPPR